MSDKETIAILGGTGDLGTGLAIRWSKAGHKIVIGSRTLEKAQTAVAALQEISPETPAEAMENLDAAAAGEIVVLTVPAEHQISTPGLRERQSAGQNPHRRHGTPGATQGRNSATTRRGQRR